MVLFRSPHPDLDIPTNLTTWQWCFESAEHSPFFRYSRHGLGNYVNANTKEQLDFSQVRDHAIKLSTNLVRTLGIRAGDTVTVFSGNSIWYPVVMWATVRAGGRFNGASPAYSVDEMVHALKTAETKLILTQAASLDNVSSAAQKAGISLNRVLLIEGDHNSFSNIQQLISQADGLLSIPSWSIPEGLTNRDVCGYLNFSSGTTGLPKSVMLSHHNIIAQCHQLKQLQMVSPGRRYQALAVAPLFHITGLIRYCTFPVYMNGRSIMMPSFDFKRMLENIIEFQVEELILVPPIIIRLVKDSTVNPFLEALRKTVKRWSSGSAPIAPEIIQQLQKLFPATGFRQGYGATESTACITAHHASYFGYEHAHTGGSLVANTVAKVIDLDDPSKELGVGESGEIYAKGPQIAMGYLNNANATNETFDDGGFLHTGDLGYFDEEGLIHIEDRLKEMIKVKGQQVAPAELEDLLLGHELVSDCAVIGIVDEYAGERPKAFVVLNAHVSPPSPVIGRQLLDFVKANRIKYKWLSEIEFVDQIPKSPTGKLLRRVLKLKDREADRLRGVVVRDQDACRARL